MSNCEINDDLKGLDKMREIEQNLDGRGMQIGVVLSRFNSDIGDGLLSACKKSY